MDEPTKRAIIEFIKNMSESVSLKDILYELYVKHILIKRLKNIENEKLISHKDVMMQLRDRFVIGKKLTYHDSEIVNQQFQTWLEMREIPKELSERGKHFWFFACFLLFLFDNYCIVVFLLNDIFKMRYN